MYLAQKKIRGETHFFIRESVFKDGLWRSRELFVLGPDPEQYIIYPGGNSFYIDESIIESLAKKGIKTDQCELEEIFWPFVNPEIRRVIDNFSAHKALKRPKRLSFQEQLRLQQQFHIFDRRRLTFLKLGSINVDGLLKRPLPFLNILKNKSRDEIEQLIMNKEKRLRYKETLAYIYASFGLAHRFPSRLTRFVPEAQLLKDIDQFFLEELCKLSLDESYRMGLDQDTVLKEYLSRYVIMHFDRLEQQRVFFDRHYAWLMRKRKESFEQIIAKAARIFGVSQARLMSMGKEEILRLFRRRARELHPDHGGKHEDFIELRKLFEELMAAKGFRRKI